MEKREVTKEMLNSKKLISNSDCINKTYKINDDEVLKIFDDFYISIHEKTNKTLEERILSAKQNLYGIATPTDAAYLDGQFVGYFEPFIDGISDVERDDNLSFAERLDLVGYAKEYMKLEKIVKSHENIVMPDLLTCDNIIVRPNGELTLIDYDGMQVDDCEVFTICDSLDLENILDNPKYVIKRGIFTKELDIKSLVHWYFFSAFNVNLGLVGEINPSTGKKITLDDFFDLLKLDDPDFINKVYKCFSKEKNEYLGEDVFNIADKYNLKIDQANIQTASYFKRLVRK